MIFEYALRTVSAFNCAVAILTAMLVLIDPTFVPTRSYLLTLCMLTASATAIWAKRGSL